MPGFFDKLGKAAQQTAAAAQQAAAESKIRLDISSLGGKLDDRARALGHLTFRQHRGETIAQEEFVKVLEEMTQIESQRQAKQVELENVCRGTPPVPSPVVAPSPVAQPEAPSAAAPAATPPGATCPCGAVNAAGTKFCSNCGKSLSTSA